MKNARSRKYRRLQILRIISQIFFFGLFFCLLFGTHFTGDDYIGWVEAFFHFDPFLAVLTSLAARVLWAAFAWSAATILVTLLFGRVVCGWVCPLGAVHQFFSWIFKKARLLRPKKPTAGGLWVKYALLAAAVVAAFFGLNLAGYLDPLSFLSRTAATSLIPAFSQGALGLTDAVYAVRLESLGDKLAQAIESLTLNSVFPPGFFLSLIFLGFVLLNKGRERFYCRYVCPTGALLGLFSRLNLFKLGLDESKCTKCNLCAIHCPTQASPFPAGLWKSSECVYCGTCAAICPSQAITFRIRFKHEPLPSVDLTRRRLLGTSFLAFFSIPFFRLSGVRKRANEKCIRPPGSLPEPEFLAKCVKCGECLKACPTNGLQPALTEAGPEGLWTPVLVPKIGYCEYYCSLCTQVCPTGAIKELAVPEKTSFKIGTAWIDKDRCLPYFLGRPCIVCEEHCPVSPKAIKFIMVETRRPDGSTAVEKAPIIDLELCIGCGICENKCPVADRPAIYITSVGEQRSKENRLLLDANAGIIP